MSKKKQTIQFINKTINTRLCDCEAHIHFLEVATDNYYNSNNIYYKQAAVELRVLVADNTKGNNGLIIDLMDDLGIEYKFDYNEKKVNIKEFMSSFGGTLNRRNFSKAELIREIAQNEGSGHESKKLPDHLVVGHSFQVGGISIHIEQMMQDARYVIGVSREFIKYIRDNFNYQPKYLNIDK